MTRLAFRWVRSAAFLLLACLLALSLTLDAHCQGTDITVTIDEVDMSAFPTVNLRVSVRNRYGVPVVDLMADHFEVIEDGAAAFQPDDVSVESSSEAQVSLGIVMDTYRTLSGEPIAAAQQATSDLLGDLLEEAGDPDRAAFVAVHKDVSTDPEQIAPDYEVPFTSDRNMLLNVINFIHERMETQAPGTPLYDAVVKAVRLAAATEPVGHRAIIVMTDGDDVGSLSKDSDTIQSAVNQRTPVFTVGLSNSRLNEQYLKRLADQTGGTYQAAESPSDFSPLFSNVLTELRTQYVLTYKAALPADGMAHSLLVHVRTPTELEGFDEYRVETPGSPAAPVEEQEAPTPESEEAVPTPVAESEEDSMVQEWFSTVQQWVQDNTLAALLGGAAILLLFVVFVIVIVLMIRRRGREEEEIPPLPEAPAYSGVGPSPLVDTGPSMGVGVTGRAGMDAGTELAIGTGAPPSATEAVGGPQPFGTTPSEPFPGVAGPAPGFGQPPEPEPFGRPPAEPVAGETRIMGREAKMPKVGLLVDRKHPGKRYDVAKPTVSIGRVESCDIVIDNDTVSRQHASIKWEEDQFRVYDLGSSNGTFVGDERVREPVALEDGAIVRFGEVECVFKLVALDN
jgi:VWFA-related protein